MPTKLDNLNDTHGSNNVVNLLAKGFGDNVNNGKYTVCYKSNNYDISLKTVQDGQVIYENDPNMVLTLILVTKHEHNV